MKKRVIICGYFSLQYRTNTAGDLIVLSVLLEWLDSLDYSYDVVTDFPISTVNAVSLDSIDIEEYDAMIFVCGPLADFESLISFVKRFNGIKKIAINVSVVDEKIKIVELFDYILPRDTTYLVNFDMAIEKRINSFAPVVGLIFVGPQKEYSLQQHSKVEEIVFATLNQLNLPYVRIDTKLPYNEYGLKSEKEIISVISKMDLVITTRLHGSILSLKSHVPFITIDPISMGAKVTRQLTKIEWPLTIGVDSLTTERLEQLIRKAIQPETKQLVCQVDNSCMEKYQISKQKMISELKEALIDEYRIY